MRKIVIASDSFKGTLASSEICTIAERVIPEYFPECDVFAVPLPTEAKAQWNASMRYQ